MCFMMQKYDKSLIYILFIQVFLTNKKGFEQIENPILNKRKIIENILEKALLEKSLPLQRNLKLISNLLINKPYE